jgi:hypothetical protein
MLRIAKSLPAVFLVGLAAACSSEVREPPNGTRPTSQTETSSGRLAVDAAELRREIAAIQQAARQPARAASEASGPEGRLPALPAVEGPPPALASVHPGGAEQELTLVDVPELRLGRDEMKAGPDGERATRPPHTWRVLAFADSRFVPKLGLDPSLLPTAASVVGRDYVYAFLILNEYLSDPLERELAAAGIEIIGPHGSALKVRAPADAERLQRAVQLPAVEWLGQAPPEQKMATPVRAAAELASDLPGVPVFISAFDSRALEEIQARLRRGQATVGRVDQALDTLAAVVTPEQLEDLARLDAVLFIELSIPGQAGHDNSMAVMGADYIRPGGAGTRFSGSGTILGILDTGFMVGGAAATTHQDLNKFGCGQNFTAEAAGVWNDQNGHGTHVLGTAIGTGTANASFRGAATGVGSSATTRIRAAKIWDSTNSGTQTAALNGYDYMETANDCGSARPRVVNLSGGMTGTNLVGTDARSRKLDQIVWDRRQTWVACSGNSGAGAGTIWAPGVAKNALAVGNVLDSGDNTIGTIRAGSSRGPTGDGRVKPNVVATGTTIRSANAGTTNGYADRIGCSMATPHVSGIATTVMDHYTAFRDLPHLMRAHLMATALLPNNSATPSRNTEAPDATRNTFGLGRVSPYVAHWAHANSSGWTTHWAWRTITRSNWGFRDIEVPRGARRLVVVMTWDEPAASAGASAAVDYDLDLWVDQAPFCTPDAKGQCGEWASQSWIDNVEYVIIENPPAGTYRLKIVNWNAPRDGVPAAIAATVIRGATAPAMTLTASASNLNPGVGGTSTITTTVANPSWVASGVHLEAISIPAGVTLQRVETRREDNVLMDFTAARALSLGNIVQGDTRSATWRVRIDTAGPKTFRFRARSENGGLREQSITLNGAIS